jgi:hypothetical protein
LLEVPSENPAAARVGINEVIVVGDAAQRRFRATLTSLEP